MSVTGSLPLLYFDEKLWAPKPVSGKLGKTLKGRAIYVDCSDCIVPLSETETYSVSG